MLPDDRRKAAARWCSIQDVQRRRGTGKGQREGGEAAHRGGGNIGGEIGARVEGTPRRKDSACRSGVGAAPRACVYI